MKIGSLLIFLTFFFLFLQIGNSQDSQAPQWINQQQSTSIPGVGAQVNLSAYWTDNVVLGYAWLATNETGNWENKTTYGSPISFGGSISGWSNFTWQNSSVPAGTIVAWRIYANDSAGNENVTDIMTFEVKPTYLLVNLTYPSPLIYTQVNPYLVAQNNNFWVNATVKCYTEGEGASCGSIIGSPRYNQTGTTPNQIVSTAEGDTPFWYLKILNRTLNGTNYILNGGFETGNANGWIIQPGLQTPSVVEVPHEGKYAICAPRSDSTTSTASALYWSIVQNSTSGFQPVIVTDDLYLSLFVFGDRRLCPSCANYPTRSLADYSYTNVTLGFDDGSTKIIASTLGHWYASDGVYLGGNPEAAVWFNCSRRLTARIKDFKPVGSKIVNITIEVRKGPDTYSRFYPGVCIDSVQLFNGTIPLNNSENKIFTLYRNSSYGYKKAENLIDYASIHQGATVTASSSTPSSQDFYDFDLPKWAIDDSAFNESEAVGTQLKWRSNNEGAGAWLNISFPSKVTINRVELWDCGDAINSTYDYKDNVTSGHLEFEDGSSVSFGALPPSGTEPLVINFEPKNTSWMRVVIDSVEGVASLAEVDAYGFNPSDKIYVHTLIFPEENKTTYIEKGLNSYFEVHDISRLFLLHNQSYANIMGGDFYKAIGMPACGYLDSGNTCQLGWQVNATGAINSIWALDANFSSSFETIQENDTNNAYVKIIENVPPTYHFNSTNSTLAGSAVSHNLYWQDNFNLSYAIFSFDNCTGSLQNVSEMSLSGNSVWSNFTVVINSTLGCTIRWCVYANDTSNNWNSSCQNPFSYTTKGMNCEAGGPYFPGSTFLVVGNVFGEASNETNVTINITKSGSLIASQTTNSDSSGIFYSIFNQYLDTGRYTVSVIANSSSDEFFCFDEFEVVSIEARKECSQKTISIEGKALDTFGNPINSGKAFISAEGTTTTNSTNFSSGEFQVFLTACFYHGKKYIVQLSIIDDKGRKGTKYFYYTAT